MRIKTEKFYVLLTLFLFTGIALYLNERPFEPRARLCFSGIHVFAIWIGFGVYAFYAQKYLAPKVAGPIIIVASILAALCLWHPKLG
jgi:hypothetical protein